ncbi:MAG: transglycosylase domain-containing protein [Solobacterium sp.]|nr:transglycosylase domain-containing protein [Solobacterium sp.]
MTVKKEKNMSIEKQNSEPAITKARPYGAKKSRIEDTQKIYKLVEESPEDFEKREKKKRKTRRKYTRMKIWSAILLFLLIGALVVAAIGITIVSRMIENSPELEVADFISEESSVLYDKDGLPITEIGVYLRENITYAECPESLVDAFLAIEDSRFFTHFGFDIPRFTKAAIENLKNHNFGQGGSTFTMQLTKNTYFSVDAGDESTERIKSIEYKVQQIYLAIKLERILNKKEIFQLYMNRLNFGGHIRGVQKAALYYFGKDSRELNLAESAMLAGIVNLPNRYNPYYFLDYGTARRNQVLEQMVYHGFITEEEFALAKSIKVEDLLVGETRDISADSEYQSYIDAAIEEARVLTGYDPSVRGMQIYTYLDKTIQGEIDAIQNNETTVVFPDELMQVAIVSMDNRNGAIVGIGGGRNYDGARLLNRATMNYKQPGSSIKPVLSYALAFEHLGYSLDEVLLDKPITYPMESMVLVNASGDYAGDIMIKDAVAYSLNIPAILTLEKVVNKVGKEKVVAYMQSLGFSRITNDNFHLSFAIGGTWFETTCKELAGAHSAMINGGVYNEPHTIQKVVMSDGTEFYPQNQNRQVLSPGSAWLTCQLMENNVSGPYFNWMQVLKRDYPVYAKTGTTDWGSDGVQYGIPKGQMKDKWMVSSTDHYTNCVWVGYDMAVAGKETYFTNYKQNLNIPGNINKLLLDIEEQTMTTLPEAVVQPKDLEEVTFVFGSYPHVKQEDWMDGGGMVTTLVSKAGLESQPLITAKEYSDEKSKSAGGVVGVSASYDQYGTISITWGSADGICSGGQRNISLHDQWGNNIDKWGACLADLTWLVAGSNANYWATIYTDGYPVGNVSSNTGYFSGWVADLWGEVRVCGGSDTGEASCTVAAYAPLPEYDWENGWWDEQGNFHPNE